MTSKQQVTMWRGIPSVDRLVRQLQVTDLPRAVVVEVVRRELAKLRSHASGPKNGHPIEMPDVVTQVQTALDDLRFSRIQPIINATGIVIHTNLGRSPMGPRVVDALTAAASNFTNLEYDLLCGERGSRGNYVEHNLAVLCGAEAATIVNNCAAALVLILRHFAGSPPRNEVIISRGELVQIGGGFRIPDILQASGADLREVGTTNQTTADDYRQAIGPRTAMILKVHYSNFYMEGFVASASTQQLSLIAREAGIPLLHDLGSGATFDTSALGGDEREPTPREALSAGADLVCFSGDKLMGGPQAGIIAGSGIHVLALKRNPFFRALRCDKLILSAMEATVDLLLSEQLDEVPIRVMMNVEIDELRERATKIVSAVSDLPMLIEIGEGCGQVGGGSLPRTILPSVTIKLRPHGQSPAVQDLAKLLRLGQPPVAAHIEQDWLKLDLRTVFPRQDASLATAIRNALTRNVS